MGVHSTLLVTPTMLTGAFKKCSLSLANVKKIIAFPAFNFVHNIAGETCDFAIDFPSLACLFVGMGGAFTTESAKHAEPSTGKETT